VLTTETGAPYNRFAMAMDEPALADAIRRQEERLQRDPGSLAFAQLADLYRKAGRTREAVTLCAGQGLKLRASGDGVVSLQNPSPGALVSQDTICRVKLSKEAAQKVALAAAPKTTSSGDPPRVKAARAN